jgi:hypothetical protein
MLGQEAEIFQQPELVVTEERGQRAEPHQVGLPLVPISGLPESLPDVGGLALAEGV